MKLQSLNCPNCGSALRREGDIQICDSCGSTFTIDYDDSDVEYERLSTEEERNRQRFQHEKEMLETEYRLREEAKIRQEERERARVRKASTASSTKTIIALVIIISVFCTIGFIAFNFVRQLSGLDRRYRDTSIEDEEEEETTEETESPYKLDIADIMADTDFMENAKAAVLDDVRIERSKEPVTTWFDTPVRNWDMIGEPEIYDGYFLSNEDGNRILFFIKVSYSNDEDDEITVVYDSRGFKNITLDENGKVKCNYSVIEDRGDGATDWTWIGCLDANQLYRSAILGQSEYKNQKIDLGLDPGDVEADTADTADTTEPEETEEGEESEETEEA